MTRMSDAMRAAAETAPVQDVHVSTSAVQRRVRRNRSVRTGANVLVGAGAIAVVVAGLAVGPSAFAPPADDGQRNAVGEGGGNPEPGPLVDSAMIAPEPRGLGCGAPYVVTYGSDDRTGDESDAVVAKSAELAEPADDGARLDVTYVAAADGTYTLSAPTAYVLWGSTVVGVTYGDDNAELAGGEGALTTNGVDVRLVNCWDGEPLPAGDYTVVAHTTVSPVAEEPREAPDAEEPSVDEPGTAEPADGGIVIEADPSVTLSPEELNDSWSIEMPVIFTAIAPQVDFTVPGDPVDDPFGKYMGGGERPAPVVPDGVLTADEARKAYEAALTTVPWGMAAGTQRVVMTYDGAAGTDLWAQSYFGCATAGTGGAFPKESAELDLVGVKATFPSTINVSYGWVVDGNPEVTLTVTNTSPWALPSYWSEPNPTLFLVKNGKVVAEGYPTSLNRTGAVIAIDSALTIDPTYGTTYLNEGGSVGGTYIWRDVNGCWSGDQARDVGAGQYTVLSVQDVQVGQEQMYLYEEQARAAENGGLVFGDTRVGIESEGDAGSGAGSADTPVSSGDGVDAMIAPAPGSDNWVSFQVWTSLGTVTVTT